MEFLLLKYAYFKGNFSLKYLLFYILEMDLFTQLFWLSAISFFILSIYLLCCTKRTNIFYLQIASGCGMFVTSKIGRTFLGLA
jgi:hypothetical protein